MSDNLSAGRDAIEKIADSFVERYRAGERPSIEEFATRYPELAAELNEILPALVLLERNGAPEVTQAFGSALARHATPAAIGDFEIVREIGRGGMGVVYEAVQQSLGRHVALKVLSSPGLLNPTHLERFRLEARAAARLHHTHIVPVFGVGEHQGVHYYAMQFIQGQSLDLVIDELRRFRRQQDVELPADGTGRNTLTLQAAKSLVTGQFPTDAQHASHQPASPATSSEELRSDDRSRLRRASANSQAHGELTASHSGREFYRSVARVGLQVAEALAYAHAEGILHRDIKPSNLLLDAKGNVWVTDFGLAKAEGSDGPTQTGDFVGTLRYMPPERLDGWSDRRSDLYSLGATLYELLALRPLFAGDTGPQLIDKILHQNPLPLSKVDRQVPRDLETIVLKAIGKEPGMRYHSADDMAEDLRRFLADRTILARRSTPAEQFVRWCRRNPIVASLTGAVAALLLVAVAILAVSNYQIRTASTAKDAALITARQAVDQMLVRVASDKLSGTPLAHPLRDALLSDAEKFYDGLIAQSPDSLQLRMAKAYVLGEMATVQLELGQHAAARSLAERSIAEFNQVLTRSPHNLAARINVAAGETHLGFILKSNSTEIQTSEVDRHYQKALDLFEQLEREFPDRPQDSINCYTHFAERATAQGNGAEATKLWKRAVEQGLKFQNAQPDSALDENGELKEYFANAAFNEAARLQLCWACEQYAVELSEQPEGIDEAERVLQLGLQNADKLVEANPSQQPYRYARAHLRVFLGQLYMRTNRNREASPILVDAAAEMRGFLATNPSNRQFWRAARWANGRTVECLGAQNLRHACAKEILRTILWLRQQNIKVPDSPELQAELREYMTHTSGMLGMKFDLFEDAEIADAAAAFRSVGLPGEEIEYARDLWRATLAVQAENADAKQRDENRKRAEDAIELVRQRLKRPIGDLWMQEAVGYRLDQFGLALYQKEDFRDLFVQFEQLFETYLDMKVAEHPESMKLRSQTAQNWYYRAANIKWPGPDAKLAESAFGKSIRIAEEIDAGSAEWRELWKYLAESYICRADIRVGLGNTTDAEGDYRKAVEVLDHASKDPNATSISDVSYYVPYARLEEILRNSGRKAEAREYLENLHQLVERQLRSHPESVNSAYLLALICAAEGETNGYRKVCNQAFATFGSKKLDPVEVDRLGWTLGLAPASMDDLQAAQRFAVERLGSEPEPASFLCTLGALAFRAGLFNSAAESLKKSIEALKNDTSDMISPHYPELLLAMVEWKLGKQTEARSRLSNAQSSIEKELDSATLAWNRRATLRLLLAEAQNLIHSENPKSDQSNRVAENAKAVED